MRIVQDKDKLIVILRTKLIIAWNNPSVFPFKLVLLKKSFVDHVLSKSYPFLAFNCFRRSNYESLLSVVHYLSSDQSTWGIIVFRNPLIIILSAGFGSSFECLNRSKRMVARIQKSQPFSHWFATLSILSLCHFITLCALLVRKR